MILRAFDAAKAREVLELAGIIFADEDGDEPGVKLRCKMMLSFRLRSLVAKHADDFLLKGVRALDLEAALIEMAAEL